MCCASAALPPLPQSRIFRPLVRASQITFPDCSMSERVKFWIACRCSCRDLVKNSTPRKLTQIYADAHGYPCVSVLICRALLTYESITADTDAATVPGTEAATSRDSSVFPSWRLL